MTKDTLGCSEDLNLSIKQLSSSEGMLVLVLCLFFNRCQGTIKHARLILGEMTVRGNEAGIW